MTLSQDALAISNAIFVLISLPAFLMLWSIILPAIAIEYFSPGELELCWALIIIGFGGLTFGVVISAVAAFIDGGF